jgi:hypothetical protein
VIVVITEREVLCGERSLCCKIFSWVRRSTLQLGAQGREIERIKREREREREREIYNLRVQIEL